MADAPKTVSALNRYVAALIESDESLQDLSVLGEVSNFKRHSSGHLYFSLKDAEAVVRCVMFKSYAYRVRMDVSDGTRVLARGYVSVYQRDGQYQLYVRELEPQGLGGLFEKFEALKAKLLAEGLFDADAKKPVPRYVRAVGVVTSPTGAAVRDIINVLTRRNDSVRILLYPAGVQGPGAAAQVAEGIKLFNRLKNVDVIIAGRGGGSIEDLWAFNEELVARSIYASGIPVISAVGHETDFTIADFVADLRAPTPSAAAEMAVERKEDQLTHIARCRQALTRGTQKRLDRAVSELEHFRARLERLRISARLEAQKERLDALRRRLDTRVRDLIAQKAVEIRAAGLRLNALNPRQVLARGYAFTRDAATGRIVTGAGMLSAGQKLDVVYRDGQAAVTVEGITEGGEV